MKMEKKEAGKLNIDHTLYTTRITPDSAQPVHFQRGCSVSAASEKAASRNHGAVVT